MNDKSFKIFSDFDGTVSIDDIGETLVYRFGDRDRVYEIVKQWMENKITSPESWYMMFATFRNFSMNEFNRMLDEMRLCPTFPGFAEYCRQNNFELSIVSDGFDIYIKPMLERYGLSEIRYFCNRAVIKPDGLEPVFPYGDEECRLCGNCKRNHILTNCGDDDYIIYIGDGYSDKCPIEYCDYVFAKNSLLKFCEINRITYFPFSDFSDVTRKLDELKSRKRLKKKHQAALKRMEIFKQG